MKDLLEGDIGYMPLPDLLQWIDLKRKTCAVNIVHGDTGTSLYLEEGKIIFASCDAKGLRLGEFLVSSGVLSQDVVDHALCESRRRKATFTRYLLDAGIVSLERLREVLTQVVDLIVMEVFLYRSGAFCVSSPLPDYVVKGPVRLESENRVFDSMRRVDERERARRERRKTMEKIKDRVQKGDFQLPVLPNMILQLVSVIEDEKSTFRDLARIVMTDQVLVSRILRVANSSVYTSGDRIDSIHLAIARMGMRSILNIATAFHLNSLVIPRAPREKLQAILDDAMKAGFFASRAARACRLDPEEAFLGGLLHDLGKTVILSLAEVGPGEDEVLDEFIDEHHARLGAAIAARWNYPEAIQRVILHHHDSRYSGKLDKRVAVVQLAASVTGSGPHHEANAGIAAELALDSADLHNMYSEAVDFFNQMKAI